MWSYLLRRLVQAALVVAVMAAIVFFGVNVIGNPVDILINPEFDQEEMARAIKALGLDKPLHEQFFYFVKNALQGDLGISFVFGEPALQLDYPAHARDPRAGIRLALSVYRAWCAARHVCRPQA